MMRQYSLSININAMSDKAPKFWNNPTIILGLMVALIVITVAILYFFYTRLADTKIKNAVLEKKVADMQSSIASGRTKGDTAIVELEKKVGAISDKIKKIKRGGNGGNQSTTTQTPKKIKCDDNNCEIEDL
jgi:hypothetical protein